MPEADNEIGLDLMSVVLLFNTFIAYGQESEVCWDLRGNLTVIAIPPPSSFESFLDQGHMHSIFVPFSLHSS